MDYVRQKGLYAFGIRNTCIASQYPPPCTYTIVEDVGMLVCAVGVVVPSLHHKHSIFASG